MARSTKPPASPDILIWARETCGMDPQGSGDEISLKERLRPADIELGNTFTGLTLDAYRHNLLSYTDMLLQLGIKTHQLSQLETRFGRI